MQTIKSATIRSAAATNRVGVRATAPLHLAREHRPQQQQQSRRPLPGPPAARRGSQGSVSDGLINVLRDELKVEKERYRTPEEVMAGPPNGFELEDTPNSNSITLTRSFNGGCACGFLERGRGLVGRDLECAVRILLRRHCSVA